MIPLDEAWSIIDETLANMRLSTERVPSGYAAGRVLATDHASVIDLPPFNKSAMDGYAVMADDEREEYEVLETVAAGQTPTTSLKPGTAVQVMTGAPVPEGAGKVVMVEFTSIDGDTLTVQRHSSKSNICIQGEDISAGETILPAGTVVGPAEVANLVSCGVMEVEVSRRPGMAVITTGNEIVQSPDDIRPGRIMDANGPLLEALAKVYGIELVSRTSVSDDRRSIGEAIEDGLANADIVVLSGGVSVGEFDFVIQAMEDCGLTVHFSRVAVKPGKPMTYASGHDRAAFGLPGNPVSVFLTFHLHVLRAARLMCGAGPDLHQTSLPLTEGVTRRKTERMSFIPARLTQEGTLQPVEYHGSAHLLALSESDGFFSIPRGMKELSAGDTVEFLPILMRLT